MKKLCLCLALVSLLGVGGQAFAVIGTIDDVPAATLLLPYFEVDLTNSNGVNTLFSINNASAAAVLAHVTVWSDQSVPVLDFDVYLTGYDVETISLRDIFVNGNLPRTASSGQDPNGTAINAGISPRGVVSGDFNYAECAALPYTNPAVSASFRAHLQAVLQGLPSPSVPPPNCYGSKKLDDILRGYITVDTVDRCNLFFPSDWAQYQTVITNQNMLWGDYFYVDPAGNFAQGETLVHIEACPAERIVPSAPGAIGGTYDPPPAPTAGTLEPIGPPCFVPGQHTFYGRYNANDASDGREPLPTTMGARYLNGGDFNGGTDFIVWREANAAAAPYGCANPGPPSWYPLEARQIVIFDEREQPVTNEECPSGDPTCEQEITIPDEAQRVDVALDLLAPFNFGWIYLNLQHPDTAYPDDFAQMWVTAVMNAEGRFSVGFDGVQLDNANAPITTLIPVP
jgi:hypothetical protein